MLALRPNSNSGFRQVVGIGGIGAGIVFALEGNHSLGRNESRLGKLLDARDYCKLHIVEHYIARIMGSTTSGTSFRVVPVGVLGDDETGTRLLCEMSEAGVDTRFTRVEPSGRTLYSVCFVYPNGAGGNITSSNSAAAALDLKDILAVTPLMRTAGKHGIALCLPEVSMELRRHFLRAATECGSYRAASFASAEIVEAGDTNMLALTDLLAMNKEEAAALVGYALDSSNVDRFLADCKALLGRLQPHARIILSVGSQGAHACEDGVWDFCPAPKVSAASTAGAGDALLAGVLSALSAGLPFIVPGTRRHHFGERPLRSALDFGVLLASFAVTSPHTIHPDADVEALCAFARSLGATLSDELVERVSESEQTAAAGQA